MEHMKAQRIHTKKKPLFHRFIFIFKLNDNVYTLEDTGIQSCTNYIGPKREKPQACLTNLFKLLFPEGGVVWNLPYSPISDPRAQCVPNTPKQIRVL